MEIKTKYYIGNTPLIDYDKLLFDDSSFLTFVSNVREDPCNKHRVHLDGIGFLIECMWFPEAKDEFKLDIAFMPSDRPIANSWRNMIYNKIVKGKEKK